MAERMEEVTFAKLKEGGAVCTYSAIDYSEKDTHISYYTITNLTTAQLEEIKKVTYDKVQSVLSKYI